MANLAQIAVSAALSLSAAALLATPAPITAKQSEIEFTADADRAANLWVKDHNRYVAIAVRVGGLSQVPPERIETALRADFQANGIKDVAVFFEQGGAEESSTIVMATRNHVYGPFNLTRVRDQVPEIAAQHRFELQRGM